MSEKNLVLNLARSANTITGTTQAGFDLLERHLNADRFRWSDLREFYLDAVDGDALFPVSSGGDADSTDEDERTRAFYWMVREAKKDTELEKLKSFMLTIPSRFGSGETYDRSKFSEEEFATALAGTVRNSLELMRGNGKFTDESKEVGYLVSAFHGFEGPFRYITVGNGVIGMLFKVTNDQHDVYFKSSFLSRADGTGLWLGWNAEVHRKGDIHDHVPPLSRLSGIDANTFNVLLRHLDGYAELVTSHLTFPAR